MKVVLFCGGLGLRMREASETIPKPMISVGGYPILLHVMKYYAHYGHKDFVLCLGYKADNIRAFFEDMMYGLPSEYVGIEDVATREQLRRELTDWRITYADTGLEACIGERLYAVRELVQGEEMFLANYADVLTDAPLPRMVDLVCERDMVGAFLCARPQYSFHVVQWKDAYAVSSIEPCAEAEIWLNGGYFVFRRQVFEYMEPGDELVEAPFRRMIAQEKLLGYRHHGFWQPMDTLKDRQGLNEMHARGERPWAVWERRPSLALPGDGVVVAA
jgi:glucose-1-phosphate cytidylyltransferase